MEKFTKTEYHIKLVYFYFKYIHGNLIAVCNNLNSKTTFTQVPIWTIK